MESSRLTPEEFGKFQAFILKLSGISVPENKITLLSNRIRRRLKATKTADYGSYFKFVTSAAGRDELEGFLSAVTTNETSFFRTEKHFDWLRTEFVGELQERLRTGERLQRVRVWSAACSTGEEPYSIAMSLAENRHKLPGCRIEILGTDISEEAIVKARAGMFGKNVVEEVPEIMRTRYFQRVPETETWEVKPALREMVTIERHNLMDPLLMKSRPTSPQRHPEFDCIFIRNVLIYFNRESKQVVIDNLVRALAKGGYLVVGPSEGIFDMLGMLKKCSTFLYRKE